MNATSQINWNPEKRVTIREIKGVNKTTYEVYARLPNGSQFRQRFNDEIKAINCADEVKIKGANLAKAKANNFRASSLDSEQEGEYHRAREVLQEKLPEGWSLIHALNYAADQFNLNDHKDTLVIVALQEYVQFKIDEGKGANYLSNVTRDLGLQKNKDNGKYEPRPKSFASLNKYLNHVTSEEFRTFIYKPNTTKTTQNGIHKTYTSFINWASKCKPAKCSANLLSGVSRPGKDTKDPIGFSVKEAERIIREAEKAFDGEMVPFFALSLFGGLRTEEIVGNNKNGGKITPLLWDKTGRGEDENYLIWDEDEDSDGNPVPMIEVRLRGKKAWRRTPTCPENLTAFLMKYKKKSGEIVPSNWRKKYDYIRAMAGFRVEKSSLTTSRKNRKGERVEFDSINATGIDELKKVCDDSKRPKWINNGARHACLSCFAKLNTVQEACDWGGNTPKVFKQSYDIGVTTSQAKAWFKIMPSKQEHS